MRLYTAEWRERKLLLYIVFCLARIARQCDDVKYVEVTEVAVLLNDPVCCRHRECTGQKRARGVMHNACEVRGCHKKLLSLNSLVYDRVQLWVCASSSSQVYPASLYVKAQHHGASGQEVLILVLTWRVR